jgi:WD40 repeat protein
MILGFKSKVLSLINFTPTNPSYKYILAGSTDNGTILLWDINSENIIMKIDAHKQQINSLILFNNEYIISGSSDCSIRIWHETELFNQDYIELNGSAGSVTSLVDLNNNGVFVSGTENGLIILWGK